MTIIPNQFFGLGDIIFTQTLVRRIANGNPIVWPVYPQFVDQLNRAYPDITFVDWKSMPIEIHWEHKAQYESNTEKAINGIPIGQYAVLPIRFASEILGGNYTTWMSDKYKLYGMDYNDWRECAMWERDVAAEMKLKSAIGFSEGRSALINTIFGSEGKLTVNIQDRITTPFDIQMRTYRVFSLFDWAYIIEQAPEIHTVNTSIIYLLEMLDLKAKEVHLYQRSIPGQTFAGIDYLLKRHKYVFHG